MLCIPVDNWEDECCDEDHREWHKWPDLFLPDFLKKLRPLNKQKEIHDSHLLHFTCRTSMVLTLSSFPELLADRTKLSKLIASLLLLLTLL